MSTQEVVDPAPAADVSMEAPTVEVTPAKPTVVASVIESYPDIAKDETALEALKQVEFYFADANLPYDKFMWTLHTAEESHYVPIATVASFKRMRQFQDKGRPWLIAALRLSSKLEVDDEGMNVRRRYELYPPKDQFEKSVYAKGFGEDNGLLQQKLEVFFSKWGEVKAVRMRRDREKGFKGSVFCEYADFETCEAFLAAPEADVTWNGEKLLTMSKEAYCKMKMKEKGIKGEVDRFRSSGPIGGGPADRKFNAFALMALEQKKSNAKNSYGDNDKKNKDKKEEPPREIKINYGDDVYVLRADGTVDPAVMKLPKQSVLRCEGVGNEPVNYSEIKTLIREKVPLGKSPFFKANSEHSQFGTLTFSSPISDADIALVEAALPKIGGTEVKWSRADEELETKIQTERINSLAFRAIEAVNKAKSGGGRDGGGRGGGRGGRGGRGGGGGRGRGGGRDGGYTRDRNAERDGGNKRKADDGEGGESASGAKRIKVGEAAAVVAS